MQEKTGFKLPKLPSTTAVTDKVSSIFGSAKGKLSSGLDSLTSALGPIGADQSVSSSDVKKDFLGMFDGVQLQKFELNKNPNLPKLAKAAIDFAMHYDRTLCSYFHNRS